jgi:hypothetical protein
MRQFLFRGMMDKYRSGPRHVARPASAQIVKRHPEMATKPLDTRQWAPYSGDDAAVLESGG